MRSICFFHLTAGLLAAFASAGAALAQSATLSTPTTNYSAAGGIVTFTATLNYAAPIAPPTALGFISVTESLTIA